MSNYLFVNVTRRRGGGSTAKRMIDVVGYTDRDTALIKAGLEQGCGSDILHCALPVKLPVTAIFHEPPKE